MSHKLNYRIVGKRDQVVSGKSADPTVAPMDDAEIDIYDVEWRHADGPVRDTVDVPTLSYFEKIWTDENGDEQIDLLPVRGFETRSSGQRSVIKDTVRVKKGAPEAVVIAILEEKRPKIAANLGIDP